MLKDAADHLEHSPDWPVCANAPAASSPSWERGDIHCSGQARPQETFLKNAFLDLGSGSPGRRKLLLYPQVIRRIDVGARGALD